MRIGIDISQVVYEGTGVGRYVRELVSRVVVQDPDTQFVLFGASLRRRNSLYDFYRSLAQHKNVTLFVLPVPLTLLDFVWNVLHIIPVEWLIGRVDVFWSSDWTQPPLAGSRGITTIHDLTILRHPGSFNKKIVDVHTRRLKQAKKECAFFLCDSQATKDDCVELLQIAESKLHVIYPGYSL